MDFFQVILDFLNHPFVKIAVGYAGQLISRLRPNIRTEAGTVWTAIYSVVTTALGLLFGTQVPGPIAQGDFSFAVAATAAAATVPWWQSLLLNGILPWLISLGGVRATVHTNNLIKGQTTTAVPIQSNLKPLQITLTAKQVKTSETATDKAVAAADHVKK